MAVDQSLADRTTLVTGASAGIGRKAALELARRGSDIAVLARREDQLTDLAEEIESETEAAALPIPTDVSDEAAVEAAVDETVDRFSGLDVLVNNAGIATGGETVEEFPTDQYRTVMGVNCDGMFFVTRAALPALRESDGIAIFVASYAGQYPRPGAPIYAATKWWTRGFALSLAGQVGGDGVGVTVINPTEVLTEFGKEFRDAVSKERFEPGEVTDPATIADAIAFAAEQESPDVVAELDLYRRDKLSSL